MNIGDRVFSTKVRANGIVTDVDNGRDRSCKVEFFWAKYCKTEHGTWTDRPSRGDKWEW